MECFGLYQPEKVIGEFASISKEMDGGLKNLFESYKLALYNESANSIATPSSPASGVRALFMQSGDGDDAILLIRNDKNKNLFDRLLKERHA